MSMHLSLMPAGLTADEILRWHALGAWDRLVEQGGWDPDPADLATMGDDCWSTLAAMAGHPCDYTPHEREVITTTLQERWDGAVTCWCDRRVHQDDLVDGTCGDPTCLTQEAAYRRADQQGARV